MDERVDPPQVKTLPAPLTRARPAKRRVRVGRLILPLVAILALLSGGWYWWRHHEQQGPGAAQTTAPGSAGRGGQAAAQPVGAAAVDTGDIRITLNELGTVTPLATVTVKTQLNGPLVDVGFKEGQVVARGDFLAQVDPRPYQVTLEQAQGLLAHDQGLLQQAQTNLKRYQTLGRQDSIAQQQVDDQRFLVAQYAGSVQSDQASVDSSRLNLTYAHVVAPVAGQVGLRQVDAGNYVQTSDAGGIVVITQMQPTSVIFSVPEDNLPDIILQVRGGNALPVEAYDRANARLLSTGQLTTLDNQIDTTTGTLRLRATFANTDGLLYPNQFVNARLLVSTMRSAVRVPVQAVQRGEPGTFVYVINANNTVSVRPIKVGPVDGGEQAVLSGLQPGERVVTDGTDRLRDGAAVTVPPPQAASNQPPTGQPPTGQAQPDQARAAQAQPGQAGADPSQPDRALPAGQRERRRQPPPQ